MRALRTHVAGGPETLVFDEVADPVPTEDQVLIAVHSTALNFPDVLLIQDLYQMRPPRPFAPGSEVAGIVEAVGANVTAFKPGDRVIGLAAYGGLAEKIAVPQASCLAIPDGVPFDEAAALIVTYATSHYALRDQAAIKPGETLLVLGASGGVGLAAVQLGKAYGARVIAAVSSQAKADLVRSLGADAAVVYPADLTDRTAARAFTDALKAEGNIDVVLDPVGGAYTEPAFRALGWQGRHLVIGFTAGIPSLPLNLTLLKGGRIIGVFYGDFARRQPETRLAYLEEIAALHAAGKIRPHISQRLPFDRAAEGLAALADRAATGKIIIEVKP
jgi:NADPH2:quinone reductase